MDPTISNFVRMICGVRQRPLAAPHLLNDIWSFGGLLKIADTTHAMHVPQLSLHTDFVVLDVTQGGTLLERWWIGSEGSDTYRKMTQRTGPQQSPEAKLQEEGRAAAAAGVSAAADELENVDVVDESDIAPAVSFGPLKIVVRCVYAYLVSSDTGIRGLNIRSVDAKEVIGPDTPLTVRVAKPAASAASLPPPTPVAAHTNSERPFCCDWRFDTGSPDLGTVLVSVRRTFTPVLVAPPRPPAVVVPAAGGRKHSDPEAGAVKGNNDQQQQQQRSGSTSGDLASSATSKERLATPTLAAEAPSGGARRKPTPPLAAKPGDFSLYSDDLGSGLPPPMSLPSAMPTTAVSSSAASSGGLGAPIPSNDSASAGDADTLNTLGADDRAGGAAAGNLPMLTPLLVGASSSLSSRAPSAQPVRETDLIEGDLERRDEIAVAPSADAEADSGHAQARVHVGRQAGSIDDFEAHHNNFMRSNATPQRSFSSSNVDDPAQLQQHQQQSSEGGLYRGDGEEDVAAAAPPQFAVMERITDDNYGCAISTTSVFHSANWAWEQSAGIALLRADPPQQCDRRQRQILPGTLGRRSCFEPEDALAKATSGEDAQEDAVLDLLLALDDLEIVGASCDARRSMHISEETKRRSPAVQGSGTTSGGANKSVGSRNNSPNLGPTAAAAPVKIKSAADSMEAVLVSLRAEQDRLLRLTADTKNRERAGMLRAPSPLSAQSQ